MAFLSLLLATSALGLSAARIEPGPAPRPSAASGPTLPDTLGDVLVDLDALRAETWRPAVQALHSIAADAAVREDRAARERIAAALIDMFDHPSRAGDGAAAHASWALAAMGEAVVPALEAAAGDRRPRVRAGAARTLLRIAHPGRLETLARMAHDPDPHVRRVARKGLAILPAEEVAACEAAPALMRDSALVRMAVAGDPRTAVVAAAGWAQAGVGLNALGVVLSPADPEVGVVWEAVAHHDVLARHQGQRALRRIYGADISEPVLQAVGEAEWDSWRTSGAALFDDAPPLAAQRSESTSDAVRFGRSLLTKASGLDLVAGTIWRGLSGLDRIEDNLRRARERRELEVAVREGRAAELGEVADYEGLFGALGEHFEVSLLPSLFRGEFGSADSSSGTAEDVLVITPEARIGQSWRVYAGIGEGRGLVGAGIEYRPSPTDGKRILVSRVGPDAPGGPVERERPQGGFARVWDIFLPVAEVGAFWAGGAGIIDGLWAFAGVDLARSATNAVERERYEGLPRMSSPPGVDPDRRGKLTSVLASIAVSERRALIDALVPENAKVDLWPLAALAWYDRERGDSTRAAFIDILGVDPFAAPDTPHSAWAETLAELAALDLEPAEVRARLFWASPIYDAELTRVGAWDVLVNRIHLHALTTPVRTSAISVDRRLAMTFHPFADLSGADDSFVRRLLENAIGSDRVFPTTFGGVTQHWAREPGAGGRDLARRVRLDALAADGTGLSVVETPRGRELWLTVPGEGRDELERFVVVAGLVERVETYRRSARGEGGGAAYQLVARSERAGRRTLFERERGDDGEEVVITERTFIHAPLFEADSVEGTLISRRVTHLRDGESCTLVEVDATTPANSGRTLVASEDARARPRASFRDVSVEQARGREALPDRRFLYLPTADGNRRQVEVRLDVEGRLIGVRTNDFVGDDIYTYVWSDVFEPQDVGRTYLAHADAPGESRQRFSGRITAADRHGAAAVEPEVTYEYRSLSERSILERQGREIEVSVPPGTREVISTPHSGGVPARSSSSLAFDRAFMEDAGLRDRIGRLLGVPELLEPRDGFDRWRIEGVYSEVVLLRTELGLDLGGSQDERIWRALEALRKPGDALLALLPLSEATAATARVSLYAQLLRQVLKSGEIKRGVGPQLSESWLEAVAEDLLEEVDLARVSLPGVVRFLGELKSSTLFEPDGKIDFEQRSHVFAVLSWMRLLQRTGHDGRNRQVVRESPTDPATLENILGAAGDIRRRAGFEFARRYPGTSTDIDERSLAQLLFWAERYRAEPQRMPRLEDVKLANPLGAPREVLRVSREAFGPNVETFETTLSELVAYREFWALLEAREQPLSYATFLEEAARWTDIQERKGHEGQSLRALLEETRLLGEALTPADALVALEQTRRDYKAYRIRAFLAKAGVVGGGLALIVGLLGLILRASAPRRSRARDDAEEEQAGARAGEASGPTVGGELLTFPWYREHVAWTESLAFFLPYLTIAIGDGGSDRALWALAAYPTLFLAAHALARLWGNRAIMYAPVHALTCAKAGVAALGASVAAVGFSPSHPWVVCGLTILVATVAAWHAAIQRRALATEAAAAKSATTREASRSVSIAPPTAKVLRAAADALAAAVGRFSEAQRACHFALESFRAERVRSAGAERVTIVGWRGSNYLWMALGLAVGAFQMGAAWRYGYTPGYGPTITLLALLCFLQGALGPVPILPSRAAEGRAFYGLRMLLDVSPFGGLLRRRRQRRVITNLREAAAQVRRDLECVREDHGIDRDIWTELTRVWTQPPFGAPADAVRVEAVEMTLGVHLELVEDWLEFLASFEGRAFTAFARTHYPYYDPQYHDPILFIRGPRFCVLRHAVNDGVALLPGRAQHWLKRGYEPLSEADVARFNGPPTYSQALHPAPLFNLAYYADAAADRMREVADFMDGRVYPANIARSVREYHRRYLRGRVAESGEGVLDEDAFVAQVAASRHQTAFVREHVGTTPSEMSLGEAMTEESIDRLVMVKEAVKAHKGLLGAGPTNTSYGKTVREHRWNLLTYWLLVGLGAVAVALLRPMLVREGVVNHINGLVPGVVGSLLSGAMVVFVSFYAFLSVLMVLKIILFFRGQPVVRFLPGDGRAVLACNRLIGVGIGFALMRSALALVPLLSPWLGWAVVVLAAPLVLTGLVLLGRGLIGVAHSEQLTDEHFARFIPGHLLAEALADERDGLRRDELTGLGLRVDQINEHNAAEIWMDLSGRYSSLRSRLIRILRGERPSQWPITRLRQNHRLGLGKIVYLVNVQGSGRLRLIEALLGKLDGESPQLQARSAATREWMEPERLEALEEEHAALEAVLGAAGNDPILRERASFEHALQRGRFLNDDLLTGLSIADVARLQDYEAVWSEIVLMQTVFGRSAEERLFTLLESSMEKWPNIGVVPVFDDNDTNPDPEDMRGLDAVLESLRNGRLAAHAGRILISKHAFHGTNLGSSEAVGLSTGARALRLLGGLAAAAASALWLAPALPVLGPALSVVLAIAACTALGVGAPNQAKQRQKPFMNAEAVFRIGYRFERFLRRVPSFLLLVDMEDRLLPEVFDAKMAVWAMRERSANEWLALSRSEKPPAALREDSRRWKIQLDRAALEWEYERTLRGLCAEGSARADGAREGSKVTRASFESTGSPALVRALELVSPDRYRFEAIGAKAGAGGERALMRAGKFSEAEQARLSTLEAFAELGAAERVCYQLWAFLEVFPTAEDFVRGVFRTRNLPDVIQTELRMVPANRIDRSLSPLFHQDYLTWHSTIQPGQAASGFLFLGGTGNTFRWEMLGGDEGHPYTRLARLLWPLRERIREEESARPRRALWSNLLSSTLSDADLRIDRPSLTFRRLLNVHQPTGVWDLYNVIEDSERGRRGSLFRLKQTRLVGSFTQVMEDIGPRLGPKWVNQRQRWIILQNFAAILRFLPIAWMFGGQYLGAGLGYSLMGDVQHVAQGAAGLIVGLIAGGALGYGAGRAVFRWASRAGLIQNAQFHVDPIDSLGGARGPGVLRWLANRLRGDYRLQQIAHLAAGTPSMLVSSVIFILSLAYFASWLDPSRWEGVRALTSPEFEVFLRDVAVFFQTYVPVLQGWVPATFAGLVIFVYPPLTLWVMNLTVTVWKSWQDEESVRESIKNRFTDEKYSTLLSLCCEGEAGGADGALAAERKRLEAADREGGLPAEEEERLALCYRIEDGIESAREQFSPALFSADEADGRGRPRAVDPDALYLDPARFNRAVVILERLAERAGPLETLLTTHIVDGQVVVLREYASRHSLAQVRRETAALRDAADGALRIGQTLGTVGLVAATAVAALWWFGWIGLGPAAAVVAVGGLLFIANLLHLRIVTSTLVRHGIATSLLSPGMLVYFPFLHAPAWRALGMALRPFENESYWTRGRDEHLNLARRGSWWSKVRFEVTDFFTRFTKPTTVFLIAPVLGVLILVPFYARKVELRTDLARHGLESYLLAVRSGNIEARPGVWEALVYDDYRQGREMSGRLLGLLADISTIQDAARFDESRLDEGRVLLDLAVRGAEQLRKSLLADIAAGRLSEAAAAARYEYVAKGFERWLGSIDRTDLFAHAFGVDYTALDVRGWTGVANAAVEALDVDGRQLRVRIGAAGGAVKLDEGPAVVRFEVPGGSLSMEERVFLFEVGVISGVPDGHWIQAATWSTESPRADLSPSEVLEAYRIETVYEQPGRSTVFQSAGDSFDPARVYAFEMYVKGPAAAYADFELGINAPRTRGLVDLHHSLEPTLLADALLEPPDRLSWSEGGRPGSPGWRATESSLLSSATAPSAAGTVLGSGWTPTTDPNLANRAALRVIERGTAHHIEVEFDAEKRSAEATFDLSRLSGEELLDLRGQVLRAVIDVPRDAPGGGEHALVVQAVVKLGEAYRELYTSFKAPRGGGRLHLAMPIDLITWSRVGLEKEDRVVGADPLARPDDRARAVSIRIVAPEDGGYYAGTFVLREVSIVPIVPAPRASGARFADSCGVNLIDGKYGYRIGNLADPDAGYSQNLPWLERELAAVAADGMKLIRVPLFADLRGDVVRRGGRGRLRVRGFADEGGARWRADLRALFDTAQAHGLRVIPVLFSFELGDGVADDWGTGEWPSDITDPIARQALLDVVVVEVIKEFGTHPAVMAWDVFNEPENATAIGIADLQDFVREAAARIHRLTGGAALVTLGAKTFTSNLEYWQGLGLDLYQFHSYEKDRGTDPLGLDPGRFGLDAPVLLGEAEPDSVSESLAAARAAGLVGVLFWADAHIGGAFDFTPAERELYRREIESIGATAPR